MIEILISVRSLKDGGRLSTYFLEFQIEARLIRRGVELSIKKVTNRTEDGYQLPFQRMPLIWPPVGVPLLVLGRGIPMLLLGT